MSDPTQSPPPFVPGPSTPQAKPISDTAPAAASTPADSVVNVTPVQASRKAVPFIPRTRPPKAAAAKAIPGWWMIGNLKGTKGDVAKAVQAMPAIPDHWKAAIATEIGNHSSNAVTVAAHFSQENPKKKSGQAAQKGKLILHLDISPLQGLVGSS